MAISENEKNAEVAIKTINIIVRPIIKPILIDRHLYNTFKYSLMYNIFIVFKKSEATKIKSTGKRTKIIRRNWKKIVIILAIIFSLLIGLGVGLYFVFKKPPIDLRSDVLNKNIVSVEKAKNNVLHNNGKVVGLFFYKENSEITNFLTWGDSAGKKADNNIFGNKIGPLSSWATTTHDTGRMSWYAINVNKNSKIAANFFLKPSEKPGHKDQYVINTDFINNPDGTNSFKYSQNLSYQKGIDGVADYVNLKNNYVVSVSAKAPTLTNKDWTMNIGNSSSPRNTSEFTVTEGTTMIFNTNHKLSQVLNFKNPKTEQSEATAITDYYSNYLGEVAKKAGLL